MPKQMQGTTSDGENDKVMIRQHGDSAVCDVVVVFRGREMVLRLPDYKQALKWARMECKTYQLPEQFSAQAANQSAPRTRSAESGSEPTPLS
jgi:hypothetical protein